MAEATPPIVFALMENTFALHSSVNEEDFSVRDHGLIPNLHALPEQHFETRDVPNYLDRMKHQHLYLLKDTYDLHADCLALM